MRLIPLLAVLLLVTGCRVATPGPSPDVPSPTQQATVPAATSSPPAPSATASAREPLTPAVPVLGGIEQPEGVWAQPGSATPLALLLERWLQRRLLDATGSPDLAASWTMAGDRVTVTLGNGSTWSDGRPLRAAEVATLLQAASEAGDLPTLLRASATDDQTLVLRLREPTCPALSAVVEWPLIPDGTWPPTRTSGLAVAAARGGWLLGGEGLAYRSYPSEQDLRAAWEAGEVSGVVGANHLTDPAIASEGVALNEAGPLLATLLFRMGDPLTSDVGLREALTTATDRSALYEAAYGAPPPALLRALLPPGHWAEPTDPLPDAAPQAARDQLDRLGWRDRDGDGQREKSDGTPLAVVLSMPMSADLRWERLGHALAEQWRAVGVATQLLYLEPLALQERLHSERWQIALLAYDVALDPDQSSMWSAPAEGDAVGADLNVTGYSNPTVARLMRSGAVVDGCAPDERTDFYRDAWAILLTERPLWPLFPLPPDATLRPGVTLPPAP